MKRKQIFQQYLVESDRNKMATINMSISIQNVNHLQKVVERIKANSRYLFRAKNDELRSYNDASCFTTSQRCEV